MISRRSVLYAVGVGSSAAMAGCSGYFTSTTPVEVVIINNRDATEIVELDVRDEDGASVLTHHIEVNPITRGRDGETWTPELTISDTFRVETEYRFSVTVVDSEFDSDSRTTSVTADCTGDAGGIGGSWGVRLHSGGGVTIYDNDIC